MSIPDKPTPAAAAAGHRLAHVALAVVLAVSLTGYFAGQRHPEPRRPAGAPEAYRVAGEAPPAAAYAEMNARARGPNATWVNSLDKLADRTPGLIEPVVNTETDRAASLARRASRRAFDGAPPVIPHAIQQQSAASCLACHGEGLRVGQAIAPKMSHQAYAQCTQCHVESANPFFNAQGAPVAAGGPSQENAFAGRPSPASGTRAWPGAPPTIPHSTWMRQDCNSCHGVNGHPGLRTTHPWRQSCTQCHAPGADLDQAPTEAWQGRPARDL